MALGKVLAGGPILFLDLVARPAPHPAGSHELEEGPRGNGSSSGRSSAQATAIEPSGCTDAEKGGASRSRATAARVHVERGGQGALVHESLPCAAVVGLALVARGEIGVRLSLSLLPLWVSLLRRTRAGVT